VLPGRCPPLSFPTTPWVGTLPTIILLTHALVCLDSTWSVDAIAALKRQLAQAHIVAEHSTPGRWNFEAVLGTGASGIVLRCQDKKLRTKVRQSR
jgi:hypothetical protein